MKKFLILFFFLLIFSVATGFSAYYFVQIAPYSNQMLAPDEKNYLLAVYKDTWNYLANFVDKETGLPYDSSVRQPPTSMSNVGLYLASVAVAYRTGLISKDDASLRVIKVIESLRRVETWRGFPRPWILVRNLTPTHGDEFSYGPHIATLLGGLIVAKTTFPDAAESINQIILKMEFKSLFDARSGWLRGGYNVKTQDFAIYQSWGHWYYKYFASETRLLSFYLIARKIVPPDHWDSLIRPVRKELGENFFASGAEEGGLFTQYLTGLFLDERNTEMGRSQRSYARYQMKYAKKIGTPAWGWSSAESPVGKYLGAGELKDEIVAPYASILATIYFPKQVAQNLKNLEALGARAPAFGFKDSINWRAWTISPNYLTPSQGMAFLSLANFLYDGVVWKSFREDPVVRRGYEILKLSGKPPA